MPDLGSAAARSARRDAARRVAERFWRDLTWRERIGYRLLHGHTARRPCGGFAHVERDELRSPDDRA